VSPSDDLRAGRAARILEHYQRMTTGFDSPPDRDPREMLEGLLLDILHWSKREGVSYSAASLSATVEMNQEYDDEA
jgi:hypothetical protein